MAVVVALLVVALVVTLVVVRARDDDTAGSGGGPGSGAGATPRPPGAPAAVGARSTDLPSAEVETVVEDGTVIEDVVLDQQVTVEAQDVVIRNVVVRTPDAFGILVDGGSVTVERATIVGTPGTTSVGIEAVDGGRFDARRVDVSRSEDGVRLSDDCRLADSRVHDLRGDEASHFDAVTADGATGWRITGNTIENPYGQTAAVWIADPRYEPSEGLLQGNRLSGGGFTVYAGPGTGRGLRVLDNVFVADRYPRSGRYGPVTGWVATGNTWSGNRWSGGPSDGRPVAPGG